MTLLLDPRAGSRDLHATLLATPGIEVELADPQLPAGDVLLVGNGHRRTVLVGVEVKTVADFVASYENGRLQGTQLPRMAEEYDESWVVVYGRYRPAENGDLHVLDKSGRWQRHPPKRKRKTRYGAVEKMAMTVRDSGVKVARVEDVWEMGWWLRALEEWYQKRRDRHGGSRWDESRPVPQVPGMDNGELLRMRVAAQFPGVGPMVAGRAAREFGSVREMVEATEKEWRRVEGVGAVIARTIVEGVG